MKPRISMVTLGVADIATSKIFYEEGLGFPCMESSPEVAFFTLNGTWLGLYGREDLAKDANVALNDNGLTSFSLAHNVSSKREVDAVIDEAVNAGATLKKKPGKTTWGGYSGYFADPDGHLWEIAYNPHFWIGPNDSDS